ncbi:DinB family protein [Bacillus sp. FJAT-49736]|uniref:DinB family protein n=1 Tax=Bacillus sp. FJAT-49736 TaxID=2833582 RepID=UPI001BC9E50F|nr:DinB family protein [Bacillus sp. FJAT-49736]MBS4172190.1 DinB family protein [Bacillus sp. FJAT-49736]
MREFFEYNWQIRDEWFDWCKQLTAEELNKKRIGGVESILYTLFHITEVEYSWVRGIQGKEDIVFHFCDYDTLERVKMLSDELRKETIDFFKTSFNLLNDELVSVAWDKEKYTADEILHHIIAHEIHHIGQLSIWSRELKLEPVPSNFIGRRLQ